MRERRVDVFRCKETHERVTERRQIAVRCRYRLVRVVLCIEWDEGGMRASLLYGLSSVRERLSKPYSMGERIERGRIGRLE